jgi:hypothetical protein
MTKNNLNTVIIKRTVIIAEGVIIIPNKIGAGLIT